MSLSIDELIVTQVDWAQSRFDAICDQVKPFLAQAGFNLSKLSFVPCAAMSGVNVADKSNDQLSTWFEGPTLVEQLGESPHSNVSKFTADLVNRPLGRTNTTRASATKVSYLQHFQRVLRCYRNWRIR